MGNGFRFPGTGAGNLPPGEEIEEFGAGVGDRAGHPRRDVDQGAVARNDPLPDLAGRGFPGKDGAAVEGEDTHRGRGGGDGRGSGPDGLEMRRRSKAGPRAPEAAPAREKSSCPGRRPSFRRSDR